MKFEDFIKKGQARKAAPNTILTKALYQNTINDLKYLTSQKITELSARKILTSYYDCLRAILEAIAALDGYKIYQHEAFTYYLKNKNEDNLALKFDRLRKIRNGINYYGENTSAEESIELVKEINIMINLLIKKYLKEQQNGI